MIAKLLVAAGLLAAPVPASAPDAMFVHISAIHQVVCNEGLGTAFEAGGWMLSVDHVTSLHNCHIGNQPVLARPEAGLDFSTIALPANGFRINCQGFKDGEIYWAVGMADGLPVQRMITLIGTGEHDSDSGEAILIGNPTVIPGMSGGPILDSQGEAVGTVNQYALELPLSFSRELRDTSVCGGHRLAQAPEPRVG